jgi:hypothetical protein
VEQVLYPFFRQQTDEECPFAFLQHDCDTAYPGRAFREYLREMFMSTDLLVVVCGQHSCLTSFDLILYMDNCKTKSLKS